MWEFSHFTVHSRTSHTTCLGMCGDFFVGVALLACPCLDQLGVSLPHTLHVQSLTTLKESRDKSEAAQKMVIKRLVSENLQVIEEVSGEVRGEQGGAGMR